MKHFPEIQLTPVSARVLGCLLEKEVTTPDQYPMTINSLVTACNQATSRHPVTSYTASEVEEALSQLSDDYLVSKMLGGRTAKYEHNLGDVLSLTSAEKAVFTVLLLRGTQTAGELKQRTERMHAIGNLDEVEEILTGFIEYPHGPLVERLPSGAGRRVETFRHLLCNEDGEAASFDEGQDWRQEMEQRIGALEERVSELTRKLEG